MKKCRYAGIAYAGNKLLNCTVARLQPLIGIY